MSEPARELLRAGGSRLAQAGIDTPELDAQLLLAHVLGVPRTRLLPSTRVTVGQSECYLGLIGRRTTREPLQHIVASAAFRYVSVAVGPGVFIPRPETELLVDAVLRVLRAAPAPIAIDLCAGSGALALALADEVPTARVLAVERPGPALGWLERNTAGTRIEVVAADVTDAGLLPDLRATVDAIVCNPPYVPAATQVGAEVRFDPADAVFAGEDGLALVPSVLARAAELLRPGGLLALEHDDSHAESVPRLLRETGLFVDVADHHDLAGRPRYALASRR